MPFPIIRTTQHNHIHNQVIHFILARRQNHRHLIDLAGGSCLYAAITICYFAAPQKDARIPRQTAALPREHIRQANKSKALVAGMKSILLLHPARRGATPRMAKGPGPN